MDAIVDRMRVAWPQRSGWVRLGRGGRELMERDVALLRSAGFRLVANRRIPEGAEVVYGPTGTYDPGGPRRRARIYVGRWYR